MLFRSAVACSIDCGLNWLIDLPQILEQQIQTRHWDLGNLPAANLAYIPAALKLLSVHEISKSNTSGFSERYLQPVLQSLTLLADDRFKTLIQIPSSINISSSGHQALISQTDTRYTLAVPVALASSPFFEDRVWLLESQRLKHPELDPEDQCSSHRFYGEADSFLSSPTAVSNKQVSWRLAGTQNLVGCGPIVPDRKVVTLLKKQRVFW